MSSWGPRSSPLHPRAAGPGPGDQPASAGAQWDQGGRGALLGRGGNYQAMAHKVLLTFLSGGINYNFCCCHVSFFKTKLEIVWKIFWLTHLVKVLYFQSLLFWFVQRLIIKNHCQVSSKYLSNRLNLQRLMLIVMLVAMLTIKMLVNWVEVTLKLKLKHFSEQWKLKEIIFLSFFFSFLIPFVMVSKSLVKYSLGCFFLKLYLERKKITTIKQSNLQISYFLKPEYV